MPRKRAWQEMNELEDVVPAAASIPELLVKIRNMWEFASLMQYIHLFGKAIKIDPDLDVEELEMECMNPMPSAALSDLGLALLKFVSSHRGLTPDLFDEYTRRQYLAKAPLRNPFGDDEDPLKFSEFDVIKKLRVLHQLSTWTLHNPDRIRERMELSELQQTEWRIEPFGWDTEDRTYFLLDDDRLYRQTDAPPPPPPPPPRSKLKAKKFRRGKPSRFSKRRKVSVVVDDSSDHEEEDDEETLPQEQNAEPEENGFGGAKWECLAITLDEYNDFLESIRKSRDPNEKQLKSRITNEVLPIIAKRAEEQQRKFLRKQKELENLQKLATAKRSGRIAGRMEKQKELEEAAEAERKRKEDLMMALKEQEKQRRLEEARESRMQTREQRLKDREVKRILHEEELARLERSQSADTDKGRFSERHLKAEKEKRQKELEKLTEEEEDWYFDCAVCGIHGRNLDDGTHIVACEKCNVWQHSACHNINEQDAERDDFHFICAPCLKPKPVKLRLTSSISPKVEKSKKDPDSMPATSGKTETLPNGVKPVAKAKPVVWVSSRRPDQPSGSASPQSQRPSVVHTTTNGVHAPITNYGPKYDSAYSSSVTGTNVYPPQRDAPLPLPQFQGTQNINGIQFARSPGSIHQPSQGPTLPRLPEMSPSDSHYDHSRQSPYYSPNSRMLPSPTEARPALAATQGNTNVRFSPHSQHSNSPFAPATPAYAPTTSAYSGAYSPSKHFSPPLQALPRPSHSPPQLPSQPRSALPSPSAAAAAPIAGIGLSPVKHDNPWPGPSHGPGSPVAPGAGVSQPPPSISPIRLPIPTQAAHNLPPHSSTLPPIKYDAPKAPFLVSPTTQHPSTSTTTYSKPRQMPAPATQAAPSPTNASTSVHSPISRPPHSPSNISLAAAPTLSPSQGLWQGPTAPPVKKPAAAEVADAALGHGPQPMQANGAQAAVAAQIGMQTAAPESQTARGGEQ